jgi:class 3 adenylate cyclase
MARLTLKNIIGKRNGNNSSVCSLLDEFASHVFVEDEKGNPLLGDPGIETIHRVPIIAEQETIGWVSGNSKAPFMASLLNLFTQKELERKKLGNEVLALYQEVNMIFNFSDKLAQAIDPTSIADMTVQEAMHLVHSQSGVVTLWDEKANTLQVLASAGENLFNKAAICSHAGLMLKIGLSGQSDIISDLTALKEASIVGPHVQSVMYAALKVKHRIMGAIILASEQPMNYAAADLKFLTTLALQSSAAIESALLYERNLKEAREREESMRRIYEVAAKFVPTEFIGSLGHDVITDVKLGDQVEKVVTVLFTDIRDYTSLSEQMTPEETFQFVCDYNETLGPIIRRHHGFINQYLGDSIMALFPRKAIDALSAAIEMKQGIREFNAKRATHGLPGIRIGIGMHTGPLVMGITGDKDRLDATTISDTVNTASRIESLTKYYKANLLLSDATVKEIGDMSEYKMRYLGKVQVKGKQASIGIYECFNGNTDEEMKIKEKTLLLFNEGMRDYLSRSFDTAIRSFRTITNENPDDQTAAFFLGNATSYYQTGVPEDWTGVVEMTNK